jgi:hypothetical protein
MVVCFVRSSVMDRFRGCGRRETFAVFAPGLGFAGSAVGSSCCMSVPFVLAISWAFFFLIHIHMQLFCMVRNKNVSYFQLF